MRVTGSEAHAFLQGMLTNDMDLLQNQPAIFAALLSPQGKVLWTFFVIKHQDGFLLDCPAVDFDALVKRLTMFRLRADVTIEDVSDQWQVCIAEEMSDEGVCYADPRHDDLGFRCLIPMTKANQHLKKNTFTARFTHMIPEQDVDYISGQVFASDINMDLHNGIAWRKGCYVGQEVVSRMKRRGHVRKRMVLAQFKGPAPKNGIKILAGTGPLGQICSSQDHQALALVRTDRLAKALEAGLEINADGWEMILQPPKEDTK